MFFVKNMIKILAKRGYHHNKNDEEFTRHGDYARNIQYAVSKEFHNGREKVVDIVFLSVDVLNERLVIGFFRENLSVENGILQNTDTTIPLSKFTMEEFEKQLDRIIPKGNPLRNEVGGESF